MRGNADKDKATPPWRARLRGKTFIVSHINGTTETVLRGGLSQEVATFAAGVANDAVAHSYAAHRQLAEAAQKAADTFADFERTLGMLGRKPVAEAAHIAGEALRAALAALDAVEKP